MKAFDHMPAIATGNCDFITGKSATKPGEQVICTDIDVQGLPMDGVLCLHQNSVKNMVHKLGWKLADDTKELDAANTRIRDLEQALVAAHNAVTPYITESRTTA